MKRDDEGQCIPPILCRCEPFWDCRRRAADWRVMIQWLKHEGPGRVAKDHRTKVLAVYRDRHTTAL
jgi:hypothetical protein